MRGCSSSASGDEKGGPRAGTFFRNDPCTGSTHTMVRGSRWSRKWGEWTQSPLRDRGNKTPLVHHPLLPLSQLL